jgi:photosystem II stability/assembly factor-like uncharacterized protein
MKKNIFYTLLVLLTLLAYLPSYSQSGWFQQTSGTTVNLYSVTFTNLNNGITVGANGTILRTSNGGINWVSQSVGTAQTFNSVYFINVNTGYIAGNNGIVLKSTNGGLNWYSQLIGTLQDLNSIYFVNENTGFVVGYAGIIFKTTDGGLNWVSQNSLTSNALNSVFFINANTGTVVGTYGTVKKTTNGGVNWFSQTVPTTSYELTSVFFIDSNTGIIVKANYNYTRSIYRTTNGGNLWYEIYTGSVRSLRAISFVNSTKGYLIGDEGDVFVTSNGGANWLYTPSGVMNWLYDGIFVSENIGWAVGTGGIILHTTTGGNVFVQNTGNEITEKFYLHQNYPNPFNPSTKIKFDVSNNSFIRISIFDVVGKEIELITNKNYPAGSYEFTFDAEKYVSGVYFVRLFSNDYTESRKMLLVK